MFSTAMMLATEFYNGGAWQKINGDEPHVKGDVNPWIPMRNVLDLKHIGKLGEEASELSTVCHRASIQGLEAMVPEKDCTNRRWLEMEIADVWANTDLVIRHFKLDEDYIAERVTTKKERLKTWHAMLNPQDGCDEDGPMWLVNAQIDGLMQGEGASEDHENVLKFLRETGLDESVVKRMHLALCHGDAKEKKHG